MTRFSSILLLLAAAGCTPNNAELVSGKYLAFFPTDGSPVLAEGKVVLSEEGSTTTANCSEDLTEEVNNADCLTLAIETGIERPHEPWTDDDSFQVLHADIAPWRGEGIITSEGDLQVSFHHTLSGGEDFRFLFVIDPDFQPQRCVQTEAGSQWEDVDGDWLGSWSDGLEARRYYLNAGAEQIDPNPTAWKPFEFQWDSWFLPEEWRAGYAVGRYGPSLLATRRTQYEYPWLRAEMAQDWAGVTTGAEQALIEDPLNVLFYEADCADVEAVSVGIQSDMTAMLAGLGGSADGITLAPAVECNEWRERDEVRAGLDGWAEINYSWVDINPRGRMAVGGEVSGHFRLALDGTLSQTVMIVEGDFVVEKLGKERWATSDLNAELLDENGVNLCSGTPSDAGARMNTTVGFQHLKQYDLGR